MRTLYLIPGLGADCQLFKHLRVVGCKAVCLEHIPPLKGEPLHDYACRMGKAIREESPVILGVSLGGMLAYEIGAQKAGATVILVSSIKGVGELPWYAFLLRLLGFLPNGAFGASVRAGQWLFGTRAVRQNEILRQYIKNLDPAFTRWAVQAILDWKPVGRPSRLVHMHGSADRLLPLRFIQADYVIEGGSHVMIWDRAAEIAALVQPLL